MNTDLISRSELLKALLRNGVNYAGVECVIDSMPPADTKPQPDKVFSKALAIAEIKKYDPRGTGQVIIAKDTNEAYVNGLRDACLIIERLPNKPTQPTLRDALERLEEKYTILGALTSEEIKSLLNRIAYELEKR